MAGIETAVEAARRYIIKRPRLTRLLDRANSRVLMLIAPAGFGKTTLAREWAGERTHVWYQGTTATADVAALAAGLSEIVSELIPEAGSRMVHRMRATGTPEEDVDVLAELFAEDLAEWPDDAWLVFDDYQFAMEAKAPERFVEVLLRDAPVRLLLTSRKRPSWASARRLLYGEVYELGRNELAMDHEEAASVLAHRKDSPAAGLVALAEGWPAVIGLAALAEEFELPEGSLPDTLYEYLAEELYQAASPDIQRGLCLLALVPSPSREVAEFLLGDRASAVTAEATRLGFLTAHREGHLDIHPLLRAFLDNRSRPTHDVSDQVPPLVDFLCQIGHWDEALATLSAAFDPDLLLELLATFLPVALREARFQTLTHVLELADSHGVDAPLLDVAEAELSYRRGALSRAEKVSLYAAARLGDDHPMTLRALRIAGSSAQLLLQCDRAYAYYDRAREIATDSTEAITALFGQALCGVNTERSDISTLLDELAAIVDTSPSAQVRLIEAQNFAAGLLGDMRAAVERAEIGGHLLSKVDDPILRTSFLNNWANILLVTANYEQAERVATRLAREAENFRLQFAFAHAYIDLAAAHLGLGNFAKAARYIERAEAHRVDGDTFSAVNGALLRVKLLLALGAHQEASDVSILARASPGGAIEAEFLATRSLALASLGQLDEASQHADEAAIKSRRVEVQALVPLVRAVIGLQRDSADAREAALAAIALADKLGNLDAVVTTYRTYPPIVDVWAGHEEFNQLVAELARKANDGRAVAARGLKLSRRDRSSGVLSQREREVGGLLAQGFTNKQIADALFISVATVKVHLNHIFEKLGAHSRTEAALRLTSRDTS